MTGRRWITLVVVSAATFMLMLDLTVVNVALPQLRTALDAEFSGLQWVLDAYALTLAVFLLTSGSLADRLGRKRVFTVGFVIFTLASLGCGLAQDIVKLDVARAVQGVGGAILFAVGPALLGHEFRGKDRGLAFGVFGGVGGLAIALGPLIGGVLTDTLGWRWVFLVNVPIGVVVLAAGAWRLSESRDPRTRRIDWGGLITFSVALFLLVLALLRGETDGWTSAPIIGMLVGSAVLIVLFILIELRQGEAAMLDLTLFRIRTFNSISVTALFANATVLASIFLQGSYMENVLGYSPWAAGVRFLPLTLTLFVAAAISGNLTVAIPPRLLVGVSLSCMAVGLALVARVTVNSSWMALLPSMVVSGVGLGLFNPPRASLTIGVTEPAKAGMASGIGETFQQVGVAVGIAGFGALFQARVSGEFMASTAGHMLRGQAADFGRATAAGAGDQLARTLPPGLSGEVAVAARSAFVHSLDTVLLACGGLCALGALLAFTCIRSRDLHPSAIAGAEAAPIGDTEEKADAVPARHNRN